MPTSSFDKTFSFADSSAIDTLIELDKTPSLIKTRDRDEKIESQKAIKALSNFLKKSKI